MTATAPLTSVMPRNIDGQVIIIGAADKMTAAYEAGTPVTITDGHAAGEQVYLGTTRQIWANDSISAERVGLVTTTTDGRFAAYALDQSRLDAAPVLAGILQRSRNAATQAEIAREERVAAEQRRTESQEY